MPLSEFYRMTQGQLESAQQKTTNLSFVPDNELVELVWENGHLMMQGQSSKSRKSPNFSNFPSQTPTFGDKEDGSVTNPKILKFGATDNVPNNFASVLPTEMGYGQVDDMVTWLNYPIDDPLQHDYCSEFLPELSGVTVNEVSAQNSLGSINKRNNCSQTVENSYNFPVNTDVDLERGNATKVSSSGGGELSRSRSGHLYPLSSQQGQTSAVSPGSGASGNIGNNSSNTHHAVCVDSVRCHASAGGFPSMKMKRQDSGLPNTSPGLMNFSHFTRPAAFVRANLQNIGAMDTLGSSEVERMGSKNTDSAPSSSNPAESTHINLSTVPRKEMGLDTQTNLAPAKVDLKPLMDKALEKLGPAEQSEAVSQGDPIKNDKSPNQVRGASTTKEMPDGEKNVEPVIGSSSVGSGNSAERASNDPTHNLKRRCHETDDTECRSEDVEEESVGVRKPGTARGGTGSKRSRQAEVHNLSERRRRDRINEKMRALQELIPNCNKVDKASMLDEAIDYLKTLQLQVQIMSMGAGLYMPPMMLPPGMQHVHPAAHMTHFSPMGVGMGMGMGMGMGYGMGMLDMNGGSPRCPMIQVPAMQGAHYPVPPMSGSSNLQGMAGSNLQVFGHPGHGLPTTVPRAPLVPVSGGPPINSAIQPNVSWMAAIPVEVPNSGSKSSSKDLIQNTNSQMMHNADASSSMKTSSQTTNKGFEQSAVAIKNDQVPKVSSGEAVN